jgi:transposase
MAKEATSKSAQIREALKAAPNKSASEIAKEIGVSSALVYNVKANLAKKHGKAAGKKAGPKNGAVNKAQRIREVAKTMGKNVRPRDIIAELAKEGITVSSPQVSKTLTSAGYRRKHPGRKAAAAGSVSASKPSLTGLNIDALIAAKALIAKVGSIEVAQQALATMKKLG